MSFLPDFPAELKAQSIKEARSKSFEVNTYALYCSFLKELEKGIIPCTISIKHKNFYDIENAILLITNKIAVEGEYDVKYRYVEDEGYKVDIKYKN